MFVIKSHVLKNWSKYSMKILIISDAWKPQLNGVVRTYEYLKKTLENAGHTVKVIGPSSFKNRFPMPGYKEIELVPLPSKRLFRFIEEFNPDAIHLATEGPLGWSGRKYCLKNNIKFTSSYHTQFPDYIARRLCYFLPFLYKFIHGLGVKVVKKFHEPATALLITTNSMAKELKRWGIKPPIQMFTRGIDTELFYPGEKNLFHDLPKPVALYVGRLAIEKSVEEFLEMEWSGSKVVVGHGPDEEILQKKYPQAIFTGKKTGKELADHYRSADVFVFPSRTDTFGIVLIEALACGLPVAAHNVIGPKDIIKHGSLGVLDEDLAKACKLAMSEKFVPKERFDYVVQNYSWQRAMEQFLEASQKTLKSKETEKTLEKVA
jgi:glycosyltransferase involved in cell wall biosynthesis